MPRKIHLPDLYQPPGQKHFTQYSRQCQHPDNTQYQETIAVAQADQHVGGIGTGDQQVNCDVIEQLKQTLEPGRMKAVIQRRHRIQQHQRQAEHREAGGDPGIA